MKKIVFIFLICIVIILETTGCDTSKTVENKDNKKDIITSINDIKSSNQLNCEYLDGSSIFITTDVLNGYTLFANQNKIYALSYNEVFSNQTNCIVVYESNKEIIGTGEFSFYFNDGTVLMYDGVSGTVTDPNLFRTYIPTEVLNTNNWHTGSGYYKLGALKWYSELEYNPFTKELKLLDRIGNIGNVDLSNISQNENILKIMQNFIQTDKAYYYITSEYINEEECNKYIDVECEFSFKAIKDELLTNSYSDILNITNDYIIKKDKSIISINKLKNID